MIEFKGIDLQDIAPVKIVDVLVSPMAVSPVLNQRVGIGQDFIRMNGGQRNISVTFALLKQDYEERFSLLEAIKEWARPWEEGPLVLPMYPGKHFDVRCTKLPEPSFRQWWESKLQMVFTTFENPYLTSNDEIRATLNDALTIGGTAPPLVRIERRLSSRVVNQTYACNGRSMFFTQIPPGQFIIDLNRQTATVTGQSVMQYLSKTSRFILPVNGPMNISGNGTAIYRERWI